MRTQRFKRWIVWTLCCRYLRAAPSATVLNIAATAHCPSTPRSIPRPDECMGKPRHATPAPTSFDNLSAHKTQAVRDFLGFPRTGGRAMPAAAGDPHHSLEAHPHVRL